MKQRKYVCFFVLFLFMFFLLTGCNNFFNTIFGPTTQTSDTGDIRFENYTSQRLKAYVNSIFWNFIEIGGYALVPNNPVGVYELLATNMDDVVVQGPEQITVTANQVYVWPIY